MKKDDSIYLEHIAHALEKILSYTHQLSQEAFLQQPMVQDAVIRQFEIIGEATKRLSADFRNSNNQLPWRDMAGMRDKLIHDYIDVDLWVVWKAVQHDVPFLLGAIQQFLKP